MKERQDGYTLIELLIALAIAVLLLGMMGLVIYQTWRVTADGNNRLLVTDDLRSAGAWLIQDAQMADLNRSGVATGTLTLRWTDTYSNASTNYQSVYAVSGTELRRSYKVGTAAPVTATVARHIASPGDVQFLLSGGMFTATLTATADTVRETTQVQVTLRSTPPPPGAGAVTRLTLQPGPTDGKDTFLRADKKTNNYGTQTYLRTDSETNKQLRSLLQFNLASVPTTATVQLATLYLYLYSSSGATNDAVQAHRVTQVNGWTETGANWNEYDGSRRWGTAGGDYDATVEGAFIADAVGWKSMTIASLVQRWVNGSVVNNGLLLESPPRSGNNEKTYYSSEALNPRPKKLKGRLLTIGTKFTLKSNYYTFGLLTCLNYQLIDSLNIVFIYIFVFG